MNMHRRFSSRSCSRDPQSVFTAVLEAPSRSLLAQFSYLQLLDVLTTIAFISIGVREANPLVRLAVTAAPSPLIGLLALKACAFAGAVFCQMTGRGRVLSRMNVLFAALVIWNLIALLGH